jgi:flagellar biosynthesis GTPase FlhF
MIKEYKAKSMREALLQILSELGEDAIIIKVRKPRKCPLGLAGSDDIYVTALIDDDRLLCSVSKNEETL